MKKFRWGMIGGGKGAFIGGAHRIAARIANSYELVGGVFDVNFDRAKEFAGDEDLDLRRVYPDIDSFIQGEGGMPVIRTHTGGFDCHPEFPSLRTCKKTAHRGIPCDL
jgi:hypothetical protein